MIEIILLQNLYQKINLLSIQDFIIINQLQSTHIFTMISKLEKNNFLTQLAEVDVACRKLNKSTTLFFVGPSRVGKSTYFAYYFNVPLIGEEKGMNVLYKTKINPSQDVNFSSGVSSVTTIPNIYERVDEDTGEKITCVDLPGFDDKRSFQTAITVSYGLKLAFQTVQNCQFVFFITHSYLTQVAIKLLCTSIIKFTNFFQFSKLTPQLKKQFLDSLVMVITRSEPNYNCKKYAQTIQYLREQISNPDYRQIQCPIEKKTVLEFLKYFGQYNPNRICLFEKAIANKPAPPCELAQKYLKKKPIFQLSKHRKDHRLKEHKSMIELPFAKEYNKRLTENQRKDLDQKCKGRVESFTTFVNILVNFLKNTTNYEQIYQGKINFSAQFQSMKNYNKDFNVYPAKFKELIYEQETKMVNIFNPESIDKKFDFKIKIVKQVFQLYRLFQETPNYTETQDVIQSFQDWMMKFKEYIIKILTIFRNTFCKNFYEEEILLQFMFIAVRGCNQLAVIFEIIEANKNSICTNLKDIFKLALADKPIEEFQNLFVKYLIKQKDEIFKKLEAQQFQIYHNYILAYKQRSKDKNVLKKLISSNNDFNDLYEMVLAKRIQFCEKGEDKIIALFNMLKQHKEKSIIDIQNIQDEDEEEDEEMQEEGNDKKQNSVLEKNDLILRNILANLASEIANLNRQGNLEKDVFASERIKQFKDYYQYNQNQIKRILNSQQLLCAKRIFNFINDVESTVNMNQNILNNIGDKNPEQSIECLENSAIYSLDKARKEQAIKFYQKAIKICLRTKNQKKYNQIKKLMILVFKNYQKSQKDFIFRLKQSSYIDPMDQKLSQIIKEIDDMFVIPYKNYTTRINVERIRKKSYNQ